MSIPTLRVSIFHRSGPVSNWNLKRIFRRLLSFLLIRGRNIHYSEKHQTCLNYRNITMFNCYFLLWTHTFCILLGLLFDTLHFYQSGYGYWGCNDICNVNSNTSKMLRQGRLNGRHNPDIFFYWIVFWAYYGKRPFTIRRILCSFFIRRRPWNYILTCISIFIFPPATNATVNKKKISQTLLRFI